MPDGSPPPSGHNAIGVDQTVFLGYVAKLAELNEQKGEISRQIKTVRKKARADGIRLTALDEVLKFEEMEGDEPKTHYQHVAAYAAWLRMPIGTQMTFDFPEDAGDGFEDDAAAAEARAVAQAETHGFNAGLKGKSAKENPYDGNSAAGQAWLKHHGAGRKAAKAGANIDPMSAEDTDD